MEAIGFWPRGNEPCGRRRSGFGTPNRRAFYSFPGATQWCASHGRVLLAIHRDKGLRFSRRARQEILACLLTAPSHCRSLIR